jgi:hypothetical protein
MKKVFISLLAFAIGGTMLSQEIRTEQLSEVVVMAANYKYLREADNQQAALPVKMLERKVAAFDVQESGFYEDDWGIYTVNFYIPDGHIVAMYDTDGKVVKTIERFKDVALPPAVRNAVAERFPNWELAGDSYRVNFSEDKGADKTYKVKIKNGDKTMRVKLNENGEFL